MLAITSYNIGALIEKDSMKRFIGSQFSSDFINKQCQSKCDQYQLQRESCIQTCALDLTNQTQVGIDKALNEIYEKKFFNFSLNDFTSFLSKYLLFAVIGIISGILLLFVSPTPFSTLGKNFVTISISLFISDILPQLMTASVNLPLDLGQSINDYFSSGFNHQLIYGIIFLIAGIVFILINYYLNKRKDKKVKNKK
jgi:hypothetical protein